MVARARAAGVTGQLVPAVDRDGWPKLRGTLRRHAGLHPAYGLHPMFLDQHRPAHLDDLARLDWPTSDPRPWANVAWTTSSKASIRTRSASTSSASWSSPASSTCPVVLHARRAVDEVIATHQAASVGCAAWCTAGPGSEEQARQLFGLGFHLGIGGPVTFERAQRLRRTGGRPCRSNACCWKPMPRTSPASAIAANATSPGCCAEVLAVVAQLRGIEERIAAATSQCAAVRLARGRQPRPFLASCTASAATLRIHDATQSRLSRSSTLWLEQQLDGLAGHREARRCR